MILRKLRKIGIVPLLCVGILGYILIRTAFAASTYVPSMAEEITTDTSNFNGTLTATETDVQKALDALDDAIAGAGSGDITSVGDGITGAAFDGSSGGGTWLKFYDAQGAGNLTIADLNVTRTWTLPNNSGTILTTSSTYVATESDPLALLTAGTDNVKDTHIDWGTGAGQVSPADFANQDVGDITITSGSWAVEDDSHAHTTTSISGLDVSADTNLTAGDALTLNDDDLDFDGGATPAGDLGGTWADPSVDDDSHAHTTTTISGLDLSDDTDVAVSAPITFTTATDTIALTQNAGTDVTADLEEETHASEHGVSGADTVFPADPDADRYLKWNDGSGTLSWAEVTGGSGAPTDADYLVGTANGSLSAEIVVGATPNGDLGGTWGAITVDDDSHAHTTTTISGIDISADTNLTAGDHITLTDDDLDIDDDFILDTGDAGTGVYDFGGADSFEIPNTAGDVTCDAAGEIALDSTQKQLVAYDGTEIAIPLRHMIYGPLYLTGAYAIETNYPIIELDSTVYPDGIVITGWSISSSDADPTTELNANLRYCDDPSTGAFPGANEVLIDVLDTTTGNASESDMASSDLGNGVIPTTKALYIDMDADPTDTTAYWILKIEFYIPES